MRSAGISAKTSSAGGVAKRVDDPVAGGELVGREQDTRGADDPRPRRRVAERVATRPSPADAAASPSGGRVTRALDVRQADPVSLSPLLDVDPLCHPPAEEVLAEIPALRIPAAAERLAGGADLSLWQTPWPLSRLGRGARVPSWLPLWLATDRPLEQVIAGERSGRAARKNDVRRVQRLGLTVRVVTDAEAYDAFRRDLYEPYVRQRFANLLVALPRHAFHHARRHGWLLLAEHEGRPVGGAVIERWAGSRASSSSASDPTGRSRRDAARGVLLSRDPLRRGTRVRPAVARHLPPGPDRRRAALQAQVGGIVGAPATWDAFLLRYRNTPAVRDTLTEVPLVLQAKDGHLAALMGAYGEAGSDLAGHVRRLEAPGLQELACLVDGAVTVPATSGEDMPRYGSSRRARCGGRGRGVTAPAIAPRATRLRSRSAPRLAGDRRPATSLGALVVDEVVAGRACGGIRIAPVVTLTELRELAAVMTLKFAFFGIACGGAKAGLLVPDDATTEERERRTRAFGAALAPLVRYGTYIPAPISAVTSATSGRSPPVPACRPARRRRGVSSRPPRRRATPASRRLSPRSRRWRPRRGATLAVLGYGRVGAALAARFTTAGGRLVGVSTARGAVLDAAGLDLDALEQARALHGDAAPLHYPGGRRVEPGDLLATDVDVLAPCATTRMIDVAGARRTRCRVVSPGANAAVTPAAETILGAAGVTVIRTSSRMPAASW